MTPPTLLGDYSAARERYRKQAADLPPPFSPYEEKALKWICELFNREFRTEGGGDGFTAFGLSCVAKDLQVCL